MTNCLARRGEGGRNDLGVTVVYRFGTSRLPSTLSEEIEIIKSVLSTVRAVWASYEFSRIHGAIALHQDNETVS